MTIVAFKTFSNIPLEKLAEAQELCYKAGWNVNHIVFVAHAQIVPKIQTTKQPMVTAMYAMVCSHEHKQNVTPLDPDFRKLYENRNAG